MNPIERALCRSNIPVCISGYLAKNAAEAFAHSAEACRTGIVGHNDELDAVRHAFWMADLTSRQDSSWAKRWGDAHEAGEGNPAAEKAMDLHNNAIGRLVGSTNSTATARAASIIAARDNGVLVKIKSCPAGATHCPTTAPPPCL